MGWIAYVIVWLAAALFWTLASASGAGRSPVETLPFGLLAMGSAAIMGVGVWRLTAGVAWNWRQPRFYAAHGLALVIFCAVYSTSWTWPDLAAGRAGSAFEAARTSPVLIWNFLMGSWLYLLIVGLSYAIRGQRRMREQEVAAADARLLAQQAQLAALRAQINPHFLFNALHTVGALVAIDPARADEAIERLGDLLRYALGAEDEVPLRHEWRFANDYLAFEALRLGDRLRVDAECDAASQAIMVPPLILQPLVENAVRHGIADRLQGGSITLRARVENARLRLSVRDDGQGDASVEDGLGLGSVRRRLAALYGDRATIKAAREREGFAVTIDLPVRADLAEART